MSFIALVDCNNFFVSCERLFNPRLIRRPVVVLSNNDGCIIARSQESKDLGIPMGAPYFQWADFLKTHDVAICSSNFALYGDLSHRVMQTLANLSPDIEIYSIDEAFLHIGGKPLQHCRMIRAKVLQWTGIPVSIGIAPTKTLAKVANHIAKKNPVHKGVYFPSSQELNAVLDQLDTVEIWGIGRKTASYLATKGIHTAGSLRDLPDIWVKKNLSVTGLRTVWELQGTPCSDLEEVASPKQTIMTSRSFGQPVTTQEHLLEAICTYTARGAEKLREEGSMASWLQVFTLIGGHAHVTLPEPTDYTPTLLEYASRAIRSIFRPGVAYKKAGILLGGLVPACRYQSDLFTSQDPATTLKRKTAMALLDQANNDFGYKILQFASQGTTQPWKKKSNMRSPGFTTRWSDLLTIHI